MVWDMFTDVATKVGVDFEIIVLMIVAFGGMIFYAKDFKVGAVVNLLISSGIFMWFYGAGLKWGPAVVVFFMHLVLLALSLYAVEKRANLGGFV